MMHISQQVTDRIKCAHTNRIILFTKKAVNRLIQSILILKEGNIAETTTFSVKYDFEISVIVVTYSLSI